MIVIASSLVLAPAADNPLNTPIFGWRSIVTSASVQANSAAAGFPASNVANPSTNLRWQAANPGSPAVDLYLTITVSQVDPIDYLAVAVHNFGTDQIPVSVEGATMLVGIPAEPNWAELAAPTMLPNDDPVIFRWAPQSLAFLRLRMQPGLAAPYAAVVYAGKLLVAPRGTHQDYVPINLARTTDEMTGRSENGHFLGRVVISEGRASPFALRHLAATWYRTYMDPFIRAARADPFFFAWKPQELPHDCGYCTLTNDPLPQRAFDTGRFAVELQMRGVAVS